MHVIALLLAISLNFLPGHARRSPAEPRVTCGITTVGYRFIGSPGQQFTYAGDVYRIPQSRWIELIADSSRTTYEIGGRELPLNVWPADEFGFRTVRMPEVRP